MGLLVDIRSRRQLTAYGQCRELFGVPLFDQSEAAEFAFDPVEITVMVGVPRNEAVSSNSIQRLDPFNNVHGKRKPGDPRFSRKLVLEIELCRSDVLNVSLGPEIVDGLDQQMRLPASHQIYEPHWAPSFGRRR